MAYQLRPYSDPAPARAALSGTFNLVYSVSSYISSGQLFGPVYGVVTQEFSDPRTFCSEVQLGPLSLSLSATCKNIMSDTVVNVSFEKTTVRLFQKTLSERTTEGGGNWKYIFAGTFLDATTGKEKNIRVMDAPNLFVLEQDI